MKLGTFDTFYNLSTITETEKSYYLIYARKSPEAEDRQVASIPDQLKVAEQIRITKNLPILETFTEARSAKEPGRPEFNRMIALIDSRPDIKGIICWKLNRLCRNPQDEGMLRQILLDGRIKEIITFEKIYTQVDSDFMMAIDGAQGQRFITDLKKDSARGTKSKLDKGMAPFLAPPGYRNAVEKNQGERDIQPHPIYFSLIKKIFELALTGNYSVEALYAKVVELKIKNSRGNIVSRTQLHKVLTNPFYTGTRYIYKKKLYTNGTHQAMITDEQYDLLQEILASRSRPRAIRHDGFLNGVMTCGNCGSMITYEEHTKKYKNGKTQVFAYYRCTRTSSKYKENKCSQPYMPVDKLEGQAIEYIKGLKLSPLFVEWAIKWLNVMHENQKEIRNARLIAVRKEYDETIKKLDKVNDMMINSILTFQEGLAKKQQLEEEKTRLFKILSKIDEHVTTWTNLSIQTFNFVTTALETFENGSIEKKKTILKVIGMNLVLKDRKLDITMRTPFQLIQKTVEELKINKERNEPVKLPQLASKDAFLGSSNNIWGG
jgi:site-specific DNA recombinase